MVEKSKPKYNVLQIHLKGKKKAMQILADNDTVMDFTDFNASDKPSHFIFRYPDGRGGKRYMMILNSQIQAISFDDFDITEVSK